MNKLFLIAAASEDEDVCRFEGPFEAAADLALDMAGRVGKGVPRPVGMVVSGPTVADSVRCPVILAKQASDGQVLMCQDCFSLHCADPQFRFSARPIGRFLPDADQPEMDVYQLDPSGHECNFPPSKAIQLRNDNLGARQLPFIGRSKELGQVVQLLEESQLVTIFGDPGIGKSSLAWRTGRESADRFEGGVWSLEVEEDASSKGLLQQLCRALGAGQGPAIRPLSVLERKLKRVPALVILDGCERSFEASLELLELLSGQLPTVRFLATCRFPTGISAETRFRLGPLGENDIPNWDRDDFALFRSHYERLSGEAISDTTLTDDMAEAILAARGIPASLHLAARIAAVNGPESVRMLFGGADRDKEPGTAPPSLIGAAIDSLDQESRILAGRLSALRGDWSIADATAIACKDQESLGTSLVRQLVSLGLVELRLSESGSFRYRFNDEAQEVLQAELDPLGSISACRDLIAHYGAIAIEARRLSGTESLAEGLRMVRENYGGLMNAMILATREDPAAALQFIPALAVYWQRYRPLAEWQEWALSMVECCLGQRTTAASQALSVASAARLTAGELNEAEHLALKALALAEDLNDQLSQAIAHANLCLIKKARGEPVEALRHSETAVATLRETADKRLLSHSLVNMASILEGAGDISRAINLYDEAADIARSIGDRWTECRALANLPELHMERGSFGEAASGFRSVAVSADELGDDPTALFGIEGYARCLHRLGKPELAYLLLCYAKEERDRLELVAMPNWQAAVAEIICVVEGELGRDAASALSSGTDLLDRDDILDLIRDGAIA